VDSEKKIVNFYSACVYKRAINIQVRAHSKYTLANKRWLCVSCNVGLQWNSDMAPTSLSPQQCPIIQYFGYCHLRYSVTNCGPQAVAPVWNVTVLWYVF